MSKKIEWPWTVEQVDALNRWQRLSCVHQFTCPREHEGDHTLIATKNGWICPHCTYQQGWAHDFMADVSRHPKNVDHIDELKVFRDAYVEISQIVGRQGTEEHSLTDDVRRLMTIKTIDGGKSTLEHGDQIEADFYRLKSQELALPMDTIKLYIEAFLTGMKNVWWKHETRQHKS